MSLPPEAQRVHVLVECVATGNMAKRLRDRWGFASRGAGVLQRTMSMQGLAEFEAWAGDEGPVHFTVQQPPMPREAEA